MSPRADRAPPPPTARTSPPGRSPAAPPSARSRSGRTACSCPRASSGGFVVEDGGEPALGGLQVPALALGVVRHLVALNAADAEVVGLRMGEVEPRHRRWRGHGE